MALFKNKIHRQFKRSRSFFASSRLAQFLIFKADAKFFFLFMLINLLELLHRQADVAG